MLCDSSPRKWTQGHCHVCWPLEPGLEGSPWPHPFPALLSVLQGWTRSPPVPSGSSSLRRPSQVCVPETHKSSHGTSPHPGTPATGGEGGLHPAAPSSSLTPSCPCPVSSQTPPGLSCGKLWLEGQTYILSHKGLDFSRSENETVLILERDRKSLGISSGLGNRDQILQVWRQWGERGKSSPFLVLNKVSSFNKWVRHTERFLPTDFISFWRVGILSDPNDTESILMITLLLRAQRCLLENFLNFLINLPWLYVAKDCALKPVWDILYRLPQSS